MSFICNYVDYIKNNEIYQKTRMHANALGCPIKYVYPRHWYEVSIWVSDEELHWEQFVTKSDAKKKIVELLKNLPVGAYADLKRMYHIKKEGFNDFDEWEFIELQNGKLIEVEK